MQAVLTTHRFGQALVVALAATFFALMAVSTPVSANPDGAPGNNGTVKIHEMPGEAEPVVRNEPKVCEFHVHAFFLDENQAGDWKIEAWAPTAGNADYPASGTRTYSASVGENGRDFEYVSETIRLANGHYKLFFEGRGEAADGAIRGTEVKHKVFWVECEGAAGQAPGGDGDGDGDGDNTGSSGDGDGDGDGDNTGSGTLGGTGSGTLGGTGTTSGGARGGVLGGTGGPTAGNLPNTAVPMELAGSLGGLLVLMAGIGYSVNRRRDS